VVVGRGRVVADTSVADLIATASGDRVTLRTAAGPRPDGTREAGATVTVTDRDTLTVNRLPASASSPC